MMDHTPDPDDLEAKRLADFSDAILRGESPDSRRIHPVEAALIQDLHRLRNLPRPDPVLNARLRDALAEHVAQTQTSTSDVRTGGEPSAGSPPPIVETSSQGASAPLPGQEAYSANPSHASWSRGAGGPPPELKADRRWWQPSLSGIAASLLLFLVAAGGLIYLAVNWNGDDGGQPSTPNAAGVVGTEDTSPTFASPTETVAVATTVPGAATAELSIGTDGILIFSRFSEESSVGAKTPTRELFAWNIVTIWWNGEGRILLSGCGDRSCPIAVDDELHFEITNADGNSGPIDILPNYEANGQPRSLPVEITSLFREGNNEFKAVLWDYKGNRRGALTDVYIIIVR